MSTAELPRTWPRWATLVVDTRVVQFRVEDIDPPLRVMLTIIDADGQTWTFEEPGWRDLGYGLHDHQLYLWSARRVIVLPAAPSDELVELRVDDDDISRVFGLPDHQWLLICETQVRLYPGSAEVARLHAGDAIEQSHWDPPELLVREQRGVKWKVTIADGRFVPPASPAV